MPTRNGTPIYDAVDAEKATQPGAPQLHENAPNNIVFDWTVGDKDGTDAAFQNAEVVVKQRLVNHRLIPNPILTIDVRYPVQAGNTVFEPSLSADLLSLLQKPAQTLAP